MGFGKSRVYLAILLVFAYRMTDCRVAMALNTISLAWKRSLHGQKYAATLQDAALPE
jgi:hypothetical protein